MGMQKANKTEAELARYQKALETFVPPMPDEILSVSGEVKVAGADYLTLEASAPINILENLLAEPKSGEPLGALQTPKMETRKIIVSSDTEIVKIDPSRFPTSEELSKGEFIMEAKIKLSDIKAGDNVTVEASENIKTKLDFTAKKITLFVRVLPPAEELPVAPR